MNRNTKSKNEKIKKKNDARNVLKILLAGWICLPLMIAGCGGGYEVASDQASYKSAYPEAFEAEKADMDHAKNESGAMEPGRAVMTSLPKGLQDVSNRKLIYTANIHLVVKDFTDLNQQIADLVKKHGGLIASNSVNSEQDRQRNGTWRVRIPVDQFDAFFDAVQELGIPTLASRDSQDVTEEYFDTEARIKSKKKLEERVLKLLERPDDKIQHVIEVERELARIRSDIERMEGRMRYLKDRIALTTITINAYEDKDFTPAQVPDLGSRVNDRWGQSWGDLQKFGANFLVWFVGAVPWMFLWGIVLAFVFVIFKIIRARRRRQHQAAASA